MNISARQFSILDHIDKLTHHKGDKYVCPVCTGTNLSIDKKTGAYTCFDGCTGSLIREAISPWDAREVEPSIKAARPAQKRQWVYTNELGEPLIRVNRKDDGEGGKRIYQEYMVNGQWVFGKNVADTVKAPIKAAVAIYRFVDVMAAVAKGETIYWVEGEPCADALWALGLPATTTISGSDSYKSYSDYSQVLAVADLVICPDRDRNGTKYAALVVTDYPSAKWLYAYPESPVWNNLPKDKGLDLVDWIADYKVTAEQIIAVVEPQQRVFKTPTTTKGFGDTAKKTTPDVASVSDQIRLILDSSSSGSVLKAEKINLRKQSGLQEREFAELWDLIVAESSDTGVDVGSIDQILNAKLSSLALETVLDPETARLLNRVARNKALRPELYLMSLLTATGSLAQNGTKLTIHKGEEYAVTPNIFTAIVAPSSQKKSVVLKTMITLPMRELKAKARESHKAALENWKYRQKQAAKDKEEFDEEMPAEEVFYFGSATGEAIFAQASRCKHRGLLAVSDELAGYFKGQNQYRGGKGSDGEDMLTMYDGFVDRTTLRAEGVKNSVDVLNYGIIGGIQPGVLKKFLGDCEDTNGNWARFIFITQPIAASTLPDEYDGNDLSDMLASVYDRIAGFKAEEYRLSKDAFKVYQGYYNRLELMRVDEPNSALQSVIGKSAGRIGKLALCLHLFAAAKNNVLPATEIDADTITKAAHIARLAIDQLRAIYAEYAPEEKQSPVMARIVEISRKKGSINAGEARRGISKTAVITAPEIREMFIALAAKGFGTLSGEGGKLEFLAHNKNADPDLVVPAPVKVEPVVGLDVVVETEKISTIDQELGKVIFIDEAIHADLYDDPDNTKGVIVKLETVTRFDVEYRLVYVQLTCGETIIALPDWLKPLTS
jgi:hypothetical protein